MDWRCVLEGIEDFEGRVASAASSDRALYGFGLARDALSDALRLKDFAVRRGLPVSDKTLNDLSNIQVAVDRSDRSHQQGAKSGKLIADLDVIIRDLTAVTWPTTAQSLAFSSGDINVGFFQRHFRTILFLLLGLSVSLSAVGLIFDDRIGQIACNGAGAHLSGTLWTHLVAASLGLLGSTTYVFFTLTNILSESAFDENDAFSSYARLVLGPAFGWLFFFIVAPLIASPKVIPLIIAVPFVAGFSTRLVIGIINQLIQAIELTLGLDDKRSELKSRAGRSRTTQNRPA